MDLLPAIVLLFEVGRAAVLEVAPKRLGSWRRTSMTRGLPRRRMPVRLLDIGAFV